MLVEEMAPIETVRELLLVDLLKLKPQNHRRLCVSAQLMHFCPRLVLFFSPCHRSLSRSR